MKIRRLIFRIPEDHQHLETILKLLDDPYPVPFITELEEEILRDFHKKQG